MVSLITYLVISYIVMILPAYDFHKCKFRDDNNHKKISTFVFYLLSPIMLLVLCGQVLIKNR